MTKKTVQMERANKGRTSISNTEDQGHDTGTKAGILRTSSKNR